MITARFRRREPDGFTGFEVSGHALFAPEGSDIVCAEVSALSQAALHGLKDVLKLPVMYEIDGEGAYLCAYLTPEADAEGIRGAQALLVTLYDSLRAVERDFPKNVRVILEDRRRKTCS